MSRYAFNVSERGFDEETGKSIGAATCPVCAGEVRTEGGQIDCRRCGTILNEYVRTGQVPGQAQAGDATLPPEEAL